MVIFSGIQPTGRKHLGNYIGAIRQYVEGQDRADPSIYCIVDLHAITVDYDPTVLRERVYDTTAVLMAAGLDPARCILFRQGDVEEHTELCWLLTSRHRDRRAQPHAPVPRQVRRAAAAGLRRAAALPGAAGRRRARLPRPRGAGGGGPARAPRADARRRPALQRALRRPPRRPRSPDPHGGRPRARPADAGAQDVDHGRQRPGHGPRARRARRDPQEVQARGDRLGHGDPPRRGQAGHHRT